MTILSDLNTAISAVEDYRDAAIGALSGHAGDPDGEGFASAYPDQVLTGAANEAGKALSVLHADNDRIANRLTALGL